MCVNTVLCFVIASNAHFPPFESNELEMPDILSVCHSVFNVTLIDEIIKFDVDVHTLADL